MNNSTSINTALCLPASDLVALSKGRMIAALSRTFVNSMQQFALCPVDEQSSSLPTSINLWAKLEFCKIYNNSEDIEKLAQLTIWSKEDLQKVLQERYKLFLLCLRVFRSSETIQFQSDYLNQSKIGSFIKLPDFLAANHSTPVLINEFFDQRKQQLINLEAPLHPELEELQEAVSKLDSHQGRDLDEYLQNFLGWKSISSKKRSSEDLNWIYEIDSLGKRSKELDEGKNNYQAGTDFENIVHQSLAFLGFKVDASHSGGAGGLDLFCSEPYQLVGECKAGKKIPRDTTQQLVRLGGMHLGAEHFLTSKKLIIGPGNPTSDVLKAAAQWKVSIMNPMSLEKLVHLQAKYPGSVDLIELKQYLEPGQIDHRIDDYVNKVLERINLRSHIIQVIKRYLDNVQTTDANIDILFGVYAGSNPPKLVNRQEFYEMLIELSSPLAGYLGRVQGSDRFYYLRDLTID
ncbi:MAG TPA: DUF1802 family protein [Leptolyngbyaceae cyanobacterium M33_DOE_097]|uniref:DUF1802 family protein n=1 Tax=Oscillatoriales cyanobacterium SpSt-418 TaxID=2282169 RepID=A0A7C3PL06_9CYAN|nr:DUF1802 family protein [Leptolyngbyaceae cyanobacterium M33_DOE_097]